MKQAFFIEGTTPPTPFQGRVSVYANSNSNVFVVDSTGATRQLDLVSSGGPNITFGRDTFQSVSTAINNTLFAQPSYLSCAATVNSLSVQLFTPDTNPSASLALGIYSSRTDLGSGLYPDALLGETAVLIGSSQVLGWNTLPLISPVVLAAGWYWLVINCQPVIARFARNGATGDFIYTNANNGSAPITFTNPFPLSANTGTSQCAFFALASPS